MIRGNRHPGVALGRLPARSRWPLRWLALAALLAAPATAAAQATNERTSETRVFPSVFPGHRTVSQQPVAELPPNEPDREAGAVEADPGGQPSCVYPRPGLFRRLLCPCGQGCVGDHRIATESWLQRPLSVTWFMGGVLGSTLVSDWVNEEQGIMGGLAIGWDINHYWGTELRVSFGAGGINDSQRAIDAQWLADTRAGYSPFDPFRHRFDGRRDANSFLLDLNVLFYPWGDRPWRPYLMVGVGTSFISFSDRLSQTYNVTQFGMPLGIGLKYRLTDALALRLECTDNVAFANAGVQTLHQVSLMGAAEFRLGGARKGYWPWNPGRNYW